MNCFALAMLRHHTLSVGSVDLNPRRSAGAHAKGVTHELVTLDQKSAAYCQTFAPGSAAACEGRSAVRDHLPRPLQLISVRDASNRDIVL